MKKGFTLIELLVVMGVLLAVSAIVSAILFSTLRGSGKTVTLDTVRQNGNVALTVMSKMIRNAKSLDYPPACLTRTPIPVSVSEIWLTPQDGSNQTIFKCDPGPPPTITLNSSSLLDTNKVSLVAGSCSFTCGRPSTYQPPTIKIKFNLTQFTQAGTPTPPFPEHQAAVNFETSVTLRNK